MTPGSARTSGRFAALGLTALGLEACGAPAAPAPQPPPPPVSAAVPAPSRRADASQPVGEDARAEATSTPGPAPACPDDMIHVRHEFCPDIVRQCRKSEYDRPNRITICHEFEANPGICRDERRPVDYCIDRFEYPNEKGEHPPVMVDFHDAERACQERSKRLCLESEWIAACEGPEETPFPYGYQRSSEKCNIDNRWIEPNLGKIYSKREGIRDAELNRLDQSVPSGAREGCVGETRNRRIETRHPLGASACSKTACTAFKMEFLSPRCSGWRRPRRINSSISRSKISTEMQRSPRLRRSR
jgi:hypothetical protein